MARRQRPGGDACVSLREILQQEMEVSVDPREAASSARERSAERRNEEYRAAEKLATFLEGTSSRNRASSHSQAAFPYSRAEMEGFGAETGWRPTYVGDERHPRGQIMMRYEAA